MPASDSTGTHGIPRGSMKASNCARTTVPRPWSRCTRDETLSAPQRGLKVLS